MNLRRVAPVLAVALLAVAAIGCSGALLQRTPPVGSLPDPAVLMPGAALASLFGLTPSAPSCRYAESQYRCIWTDTANPNRKLRVTVWADPAIAPANEAAHLAAAVAIAAAMAATISP